MNLKNLMIKLFKNTEILCKKNKIKENNLLKNFKIEFKIFKKVQMNKPNKEQISNKNMKRNYIYIIFYKIINIY